MKIIVETDNLTELEQFAEELLARRAAAVTEAVTVEPEVAEEKPEPVAEIPAEPVKAEETTPEVEVTAVEVRRKLTEANKVTGKKIATDLIKAMGFEKLSDVPKERYAELAAKADEVIANAAD